MNELSPKNYKKKMSNFLCLLNVVLFAYLSVNDATCSVIDGNSNDNASKHHVTLETLRELQDVEIVQFLRRNDKTKHYKENLKIRRSGRSTSDSGESHQSEIIGELTPIWLAWNNKLEKADGSIIREAVKFYNYSNFPSVYEYDFDEFGNAYFLGSIDDKVVSPLSKRAVRSLMIEKPYLFKDTLPPGSTHDDYVVSPYHVLYASDLVKGSMKYYADSNFLHKFGNNKTADGKLRRSVDTVYPEILLVVDYNARYTRPREVRFLQLLTYLISFWNSVDLRYRTLSEPKIRLRITGIVISMEPGAISFIKDNTDSNGLNAGNVIKQSYNWVNNQRQLSAETDYDIVMTMTSSTLCYYNAKTRKCEAGGILGLAYIGVSCSYKPHMTGVFHDNQNFKDVIVAAHELGHILGAEHDYPNSTRSCVDSKGYIMSWTSGFEDRQFEWSICSQKNFKKHLQSRHSRCFQNEKPVHDSGPAVRELLAGKKITVEDQCDQLGYGRVCESNDVCKNLRCRHAAWFCVYTDVPALDGTPCHDGGTCRNGVCEK